MKSWLDESQAEIKTAGRNISNLRYADDTTVMSESEEEVKTLLMKVKDKSEKTGLKKKKKTGLKVNSQKTKVMASVPSIHGKQKGKKWKQ